MLDLVEELRSQEEPDRRPKLQGSVSDSRSASIYLIHEEDLPASIRESDQEKSADNTHVSPPQTNARPRTLSWENAVASKPPIVKRKVPAHISQRTHTPTDRFLTITSHIALEILPV